MRCPICNGNSKVFMRGIFDCENTKVQECDNCKVHFLNPMMSDEEEEQYYKNYYENQKLRHSSSYNIKDIQKKAYLHYKEYYNTYYDLVSNAENILEIGSGSGGFLEFIQRHTSGKNVVSIERSDSNYEFLKEDFPSVTINQELNKNDNQKFDLIVAFGVFEHIKDLYSFLENLKSKLKDNDSKIVFTVPSNSDALISFFKVKEYKKFMYMKQHYYVFSKESFYQIANYSKLKVDNIKYIQVWGMDNHLSWLNDRKVQDFTIYTNMISEKTKSEYKKNLIEKEMTDLVMVSFKKDLI